MIKRSSKFENGSYRHNERIIRFQRIFGGIAWPGNEPGALIVLGEEDYYDDRHWYLLAEGRYETADDLIEAATRLGPEMDIDRWLGRHGNGTKEYLNFKNRQAHDGGRRVLYVGEAPGPEADPGLLFHINIILDCVKPERKKLHFFGESSLPAELQSVQGNLHQVTNIDHPAVAALGYVLSELIMHPHYEHNPAECFPEPEPDF